MNKPILRRILFALGIISFLSGTAAKDAVARGYEVKLEVWTERGFDSPYCAYDDEVDLYIRPSRSCYITVLVIDPDGYANVVYPRYPREQRKLRRGRVYRLSELTEVGPLFFDGLEGRAYISVIASRRPAFINTWVLDEVDAFCTSPRYHGVAFRLGFGLTSGAFGLGWSRHVAQFGYGVFTATIRLGAGGRYHHHADYRHRSSHRRWARSWSYRSRRPVIAYKGARRHEADKFHRRKFKPRRQNSDEYRPRKRLAYSTPPRVRRPVRDRAPRVEKRKSERRSAEIRRAPVVLKKAGAKQAKSRAAKPDRKRRSPRKKKNR